MKVPHVAFILAGTLLWLSFAAACGGGGDKESQTATPSLNSEPTATSGPPTTPAPSPTRTPKPHTPRPTQPPFNAIAPKLQMSGITGGVGTRDASLFCFIKPYQGVSHGDVYLVKGDATGLTKTGLVANSCGFSPDGRWLSTAQFVAGQESAGGTMECYVSAIQDDTLAETRDVGHCESIAWISDSQHFYMEIVSGYDASGFVIFAAVVKSLDGTKVGSWPDWQVPVAATSEGRIIASNERWKLDASGGGSLYYDSFFVTDLTGTDHLPLTPDLVVLTQDSQAPLCDSGLPTIEQQQGTKLFPC